MNTEEKSPYGWTVVVFMSAAGAKGGQKCGGSRVFSVAVGRLKCVGYRHPAQPALFGHHGGRESVSLTQAVLRASTVLNGRIQWRSPCLKHLFCFAAFFDHDTFFFQPSLKRVVLRFGVRITWSRTSSRH